MLDHTFVGDHRPQSRKHVTRKQMQHLESGIKVVLNSNQLEELLEQAPEFVEINIHETSSLMGEHIVSIRDTRPGAEQQHTPKLGIHLNPDGTIVPSAPNRAARRAVKGGKSK